MTREVMTRAKQFKDLVTMAVIALPISGLLDLFRSEPWTTLYVYTLVATMGIGGALLMWRDGRR